VGLEITWRPCDVCRNIRRDCIKTLDKRKSEMSEDEVKAITDSIQELTDDYVKQIEKIVKSKQEELTTV
jgi:ribosome recycling factor